VTASTATPTPAPTAIRGRDFAWGSRTFLMGIVNVTPDSFSGDGLLAAGAGATEAAVTQVRRMVAEGVDIVDVGGESTRPGHAPVGEAEERDRVVPVIRAIRNAFPALPVSVDTTKAAVATAALDAGADAVNDVWGTAPDAALLAVVAERRVPYVLMHNRAEPRYEDVVADVLADLAAAIERAVDGGVARERILVDPGIGFGKTAEHNLALLARLAALRSLGRPILLGTSRKSTIGRVLDLPADQRLEGTLATTALAVSAGVDIVRVHDVEANRRAARVADAIVRGGATLAPVR
jgi:dihydropteroate synthase